MIDELEDLEYQKVRQEVRESIINITEEEDSEMGLFSKKKKEDEAPKTDEIINNGDGTITFYDKYGNSHTVAEDVDKDEYLRSIYEYLDDKGEEVPQEDN